MPYYVYTSKERREMEQQQGAGLLVILFITLAFFNAPGMLLLASIKDASGVAWDVGQMWTFSILASVLVLVALRVMVELWSEAFKLYIALCVAITVVLLVCNFGLKASFPARYLEFFFETGPA